MLAQVVNDKIPILQIPSLYKGDVFVYVFSILICFDTILEQSNSGWLRTSVFGFGEQATRAPEDWSYTETIRDLA